MAAREFGRHGFMRLRYPLPPLNACKVFEIEGLSLGFLGMRADLPCQERPSGEGSVREQGALESAASQDRLSFHPFRHALRLSPSVGPVFDS